MTARRGSVPSTILISGAILFLVALLSGISYEQFGRARDRDRFPQIGRSVDIGGHSLNLFCSGEGRPAVIFESGAPWVSSNPEDIWEKGMPRPGYSWVAIQRETAKFTRACWYDRAGAGWSDLGPYPRSSSSQARDLHALLQAAQVPPPYVLVAESSAALDSHVYTGFYPSEVDGLVFADGVHPDFFRRSRPGGGRFERVPQFIGHSQDASAQLFNLFGLYRFLSKNPAPPTPPKGMTPTEWSIIWHLTEAPKARTALLQEIGSLAQSVKEARDAGSLGNRRVVVITSENAAVSSQSHAVWLELQEDLSRLSTRGTLVQVKESGADLIYQAPDAILTAVRQEVGEINATTVRSPVAHPRP